MSTAGNASFELGQSGGGASSPPTWSRASCRPPASCCPAPGLTVKGGDRPFCRARSPLHTPVLTDLQLWGFSLCLLPGIKPPGKAAVEILRKCSSASSNRRVLSPRHFKDIEIHLNKQKKMAELSRMRHMNHLQGGKRSWQCLGLK